MKKNTIIYPGSFDPFHEGHRKLIIKACDMFDKVVVVVTKNINKTPNVNIDSRVDLIKEQLKNLNVEVVKNDNLLTAHFAKQIGANYLLRGIRNHTDFDYEYEMAKANKLLNNDLQTVFLFAEEEDREISSSTKKEIEKYLAK